MKSSYPGNRLVSLPGYVHRCGLCYTIYHLQALLIKYCLSKHSDNRPYIIICHLDLCAYIHVAEGKELCGIMLEEI